MTAYGNIVNELAELYQDEKSMFLTENDVVLWLGRMLHDVVGQGLEVHSELRPWIPEDLVIRANKWDELKQLNWCSKVDLAVTDSKYFQLAYDKIKKIQGKKSGLKYWRILLYPLEAFRAVFEVKARVSGNLDLIYEDIEKLSLMQCRHEDCEYYLLVFDKAASDEHLKQIEEEVSRYDSINYVLVNEENIYPLTTPKI